MIKPFDKRSVPGLEDCSSESDLDNDIPTKKTRHDDDVEIEIEVKNNEFLKEEIQIGDTLTSKRKNLIWGNVVQDEILDEGLKRIGVNKFNVNRSVESYTIQEERNKHRARKRYIKHTHKQTNFDHTNKAKLPVKDRILNRTVDHDKRKDRVKFDPNMQSIPDIISHIAKLLAEPKIELIEKCFTVLGAIRSINFYYLTEDIEENGGLLILDGSRRRSPGGVYFNLIKESPEVSNEEKKLIFMFDLSKRNGHRVNGAERPTPPTVIQNQSNHVNKTNPIVSVIVENGLSKQTDEELEDGEIP